MLVELDLLLFLWIQYGDTGAAIVQQHLFKVVEDALQDGQIDMLSIEIFVLARVPMMACFQNDIDGSSQAIQEIDE